MKVLQAQVGVLGYGISKEGLRITTNQKTCSVDHEYETAQTEHYKES